MPIRWLEIFKKEDDLAKAHAERVAEDHANPKDELALTIRQLQDQHDQLEHAAAVVLAEARTASDRLQRDLERERQLTIQGQAAMKAGHTDAAKSIALQLTTMQQTLAAEQPAYTKAQAAADQAKEAFRENSEMLQAKMEEAKQLEAEIDQAAVQTNINQAMQPLTSITNHGIPSFDQLRDKVHQRSAEAQATGELTSASSEFSEVHAAHLASEAAADDLLAQWGGGTSSGHRLSAPTALASSTTPHVAASSSPIDRL